MKCFTSRCLATAGALLVSATTVSATAGCPTDFDTNRITGFSDLTALLAAWGPCEPCVHDLDGNGVVGFADLTTLLAAWGPCGLPYPDYDDAFANQVGTQELLDASGPLTLPQELYDRVSRDIGLLMQERPELVGAPHNASWMGYRMLVLVDEQASPQAIQETLDHYQAEILVQRSPVLVLDFPRGINIPALVPIFSELEWVTSAEVDRVFGAPTPNPGWTPRPVGQGWWEWTVVVAWADGGICDEAQTLCECATTYSFLTRADGAVFEMGVSSEPYADGNCTGYPPAP